MRAIQFLAGVLLLLVPEILRVYYIMPFPGSQEDVATDLRQVTIAHWLHNHICLYKHNLRNSSNHH